MPSDCFSGGLEAAKLYQAWRRCGCRARDRGDGRGGCGGGCHGFLSASALGQFAKWFVPSMV